VGWIPGLVVQGVLATGNPTVNGVILLASAVSLLVYLFLSLRRFDREGRQLVLSRTVAEGQE